MSLETALAHLHAEEPEPALAALLEAWRENGDARLAQVIDRLSDRLTERIAPIGAVGGTSAKAAWYKAAESKRPAVLGRLLEALPSGMDRGKRLEALLAWPPDPRIGTAAMRWIENSPVGINHRVSFFFPLWKLVEYTRDARLVPLLKRLSDPSMQTTAQSRFGRATPAFYELAVAFEALPVPAPLDVSRIEALIDKPLPKPVVDTNADPGPIFARVYADPDDDEPRAVLADLLQQRGDPRGEFIALQMARHGTEAPRAKQERKLEQQWGQTWLGPLVDVVAKAGLEFERGFVTHARLSGPPAHEDAPEWSTLTHLDVSQARARAASLLLRLRNLRHVTGLAADDYPKLVAANTLPWETVGWRIRYWESRGDIAKGSGTTFAAARTLILEGFEEAWGLHTTTLDGMLDLLEKWPNLTRFEIDTDPRHIPAVLESARGKALACLVMNDGPFTAKIEGDAMTFGIRRQNEPAIERVVTLIGPMAPKRIVVAVDGKGSLDGEVLSGKKESVSIASIIAAARAAGAALEVQGTKFS